MTGVATLYYTVNDRPVKIVPLPDGGSDALVFDWSTGAFVPDRDYFGHVSRHGNDVDKLSIDVFAEKVRDLRRGIAAKWQAMPIVWERTGNGEFPFKAQVDDRSLTIRVNDFPAEPLYTVVADGEDYEDLEDWPEAWVKGAS